MKVLLTGAGGQLGRALIASAPQGVDLVATSRQQLDLADPSACRAAVQEHKPDWVLNSAYTAVDKAEAEPDQAHAVNAGAPEAFARSLHEQDLLRSTPTSSSTEPKARPINLCRLVSLSGSTEPAKRLEKRLQNTFGTGGQA